MVIKMFPKSMLFGFDNENQITNVDEIKVRYNPIESQNGKKYLKIIFQ